MKVAPKLNLADPVDEIINFPNCDSIPVKIVGVVKDFNVQGFGSEIQPVVFTIGNQDKRLLCKPLKYYVKHRIVVVNLFDFLVPFF